jgi:DNA-binding XRE family transcriptional regulator
MNLEAELARISMSKDMLSKELGISRKCLYLKMSGKTDFTLTEMKKIQSILSQFTLEYLFASNNESA